MSAVSNISLGRRLSKKAKVKSKDPLNVVKKAHPRRLPYEIWSLVFSYLPRNDLTRVARVSRTFLPICRLEIYHSVTLRSSDHETYPYMLNVIKHIDGLAGSVRRASVFTSWAPWTAVVPSTTWVDVDLFTRFTGLCTLTFIGCPFMLQDEQAEFVETVGRCCSALKSFTYIPYYLTVFPNPSFAIRGLESACWHTYLSSSPEPQCLSLLTASAYTLTTLSFPTCPGYPIGKRASDPNTWAALLSLRFPNLVSFHIELMYPECISLRQEDTPQMLTKFLAVHPRLVRLALGTSSDFAHVYEGLSGTSELITPDFLPALRTLEAHPANLVLMRGARVRSLHKLTRLTLTYYIPQDQHAQAGAVAELIRALEGSSGFPYVEELGLHFNGAFNEIPPVALHWVRELGVHFPAVLSWSGHLGVVLPWTLAEALAPYNLVKTVHLPYTTLATERTDGSFSADDFTPVSKSCPQLAAMTIKTHIQQPLGVKYAFNRDEDGVLKSITVSAPE